MQCPLVNLGMDPVYESVIREHFNVLDVIESKEFDADFGVLTTRLTNTRKDPFAVDDRYVIVKFDTDFYWHGHGVYLNNLFEVWRHLDIPFYTMMIYTNHIGISREIDQLCQDRHEKDRPTVIETILNAVNQYPTDCAEPELALDAVQHQALCLMGSAHRSHRIATYSSLRDIDPQRLVMTIRKTDVSLKD